MFWDYCVKEDLEETRGVHLSTEATPAMSLPWLVFMGDLEIRIPMLECGWKVPRGLLGQTE